VLVNQSKNQYKEVEFNGEKNKPRFVFDDILELSSALSLKDLDRLITLFKDRILVSDYEAPFPIVRADEECCFCMTERGALEIFQKIGPAYETESLLNLTSFGQWMNYKPTNVNSDYDDGLNVSADENTVVITFTKNNVKDYENQD